MAGTVSDETLVTTQFISEQKELPGKKRLRALAVVSAVVSGARKFEIIGAIAD
jgi:hypothetical protein